MKSSNNKTKNDFLKFNRTSNLTPNNIMPSNNNFFIITK